MTAFIVILSILLVLAFLLTRYAGIMITYREDVGVTVTYWFVRYTLGKSGRPKVKKEKKPKKKKKKTEEAPSGPSPRDREAEKRERREKRDAIMAVVREVKKILPGFFGKIHFRSAKLYCRIATGDAASTALATAGAKASASILFETIDNFAVLDGGSERNVAIEPDFLSDKSAFDIDVRLRVRVIFALFYGLKVLFAFIKQKIKSENKLK